MAARYWVAGGTGNWSSTTNWAATSGGASGASVPGTADTALFNASSGAGTATVDSNVTILTLTMTGFTGTLAFGTNSISLSSTGTVFTGATTCTVTGTPVINVTSTFSTAITVTTAAVTEANSISFNFTGGTYALTFLGTASHAAKNVDFTGFAGTWGATSTATIYGNLTLSTGMTLTTSASALTFGGTSGTKYITTNAKTLDFSLTFNGVGSTWQLADALTVGSTRTVTLTNGTLNLNDKTLTTGFFSSNNSNTRNLAFGVGNIICVGAGGTLWTTANVTGLTVTGTPVVNISYSGATATTVSTGVLSEANSISFNFTAGTYALTFLATGNYSAKNVNFTGFAGTLGATSTAVIYGNLTISTGMTLTTSASALTFGGTSGTKYITTNAKTLDFPITLNGVGSTWQLVDALTMGTSNAFTHTNGTLDLNEKTLTVGTAYTTATGTKNLTFNGGTLVCPTASTTAFNNAQPTNYTTTAGTGTGKISMTGATAKTFVGGGSTFNCTLSNDGAGALTVTGANTFTTIANGVQPTSFLFTAGTTTTVTNWSVSGTSGNLVTIASVTAATHTLSQASGTILSEYVSVTNSIATGGATWYAAYGSTDGGGNTGWIFGVARFRVGSAGNWSSTAIWSTNSSGAGGASVPTLPDGVFFTIFTLTNVTTLDVSPQIYSLDMTTVTRDFNFGTNSITINSTQGTVLNGLGLSPTSSTADNTVIIASTKSNAITVIPSNGTVPFSLNFTGGTYSLTFMDTGSKVKNLNFTGFSGTWTTTTGGTSNKSINGNLTLSSGMTITASTENVSVASTTGTIVVTSNGKDIPMPVTFSSSVGATVQLADAMSVSANAFTFSRGGLDLNGKVLTVLNFSSASNTRVLTFNGGTIVCTRSGGTAFNLVNATGFTSVAGTGVGKISMTAATAKTFAGLSAVYNCTLSNDGAGALTITGSNTFTTIANGVQPTAFTFTAATTQTVTNWNVSGTAGNLVTIISSTAGVPALLSKASGTVSSDYLSLKDSTALGGAAWYAGANSTNVSGNLGWIFTAPPATNTGNFFFMF